MVSPHLKPSLSSLFFASGVLAEGSDPDFFYKLASTPETKNN